MKIPPEALIPPEKLTGYLLVLKPEDDKSGFLEQAGFTLENPEALEAAIRAHTSQSEAEVDRVNRFGEYYVVKGELVGLNGRNLRVITVWIRDSGSESIRFVTLKPWRNDDET